MTGRITLFLAVIAAVSVGFIAAPRKIDARPRGLHVTIGTATFPQDGQTLNKLLAVADSRLYEQRGIELRPDS